MHRKIATVALGLVLGTASLARADEDHMRVKVGDLNLASPEGVKIARSRVYHAVELYCGPRPIGALDFAQLRDKCRQEMTAKASAAMDVRIAQASGGVVPVQLVRR